MRYTKNPPCPPCPPCPQESQSGINVPHPNENCCRWGGWGEQRTTDNEQRTKQKPDVLNKASDGGLVRGEWG